MVVGITSQVDNGHGVLFVCDNRMRGGVLGGRARGFAEHFDCGFR